MDGPKILCKCRDCKVQIVSDKGGPEFPWSCRTVSSDEPDQRFLFKKKKTVKQYDIPSPRAVLGHMLLCVV